MIQKNKFIFFRNDQHQQTFEFDASKPDCLDHVEYRYFGRVLNLLEPQIRDLGLTVYVTAWTVHELPTYGPRVVSFILQDEWSREPKYRDRVGAVFRTCGKFPYNLEAYKYGGFYDWISNFLGQTRAMMQDHGGRLGTAISCLKGKKIAPIYSIPLGYFADENIPYKPILERDYDLFFAGSVQHSQKRRYFIKRPKELARARMEKALEDVALRNIEITVKTRLTGSFEDSIETDNTSYLQNMMNTKICPVPRGANLETFRFYEAIRYGCIPVGEAFPNEEFYKNAPIIRLKDWSTLAQTVMPLLQNADKLQDMHQKTLAWWQEHCSEKALAGFIYDRLKEIYQA
nr:hypothetical protein [Cytophagales bacterium]